MPRTRRSHSVSAVVSDPGPVPRGPFPADTAIPAAPPVKRRTVASNALAIDSMGAQLYTMSQLLEKISDKVCRDSTGTGGVAMNDQPAQPAALPVFAAPHPPGFPAPPPATPQPLPTTSWLTSTSGIAPNPRTRHPTDSYQMNNLPNNVFTASAHLSGSNQFSAHLPAHVPPAQPPAAFQQARTDPLGLAGTSRSRLNLPVSLQDLEDDDTDLNTRVTHRPQPGPTCRCKW